MAVLVLDGSGAVLYFASKTWLPCYPVQKSISKEGFEEIVILHWKYLRDQKSWTALVTALALPTEGDPGSSTVYLR